MKTRVSRPSPVTIVLVFALVAALAGPALAGPDASTTAVSKATVKKLAKKIAQRQINALAPGLADAQIDKRAPGLSVASAANANALGGNPATAFASSTSEPYHEVGAVGEPAFKNGWANGSDPTSTAAFYKDPLGVVHLKGQIGNNTADGTVAFTLPPGYRPSQQLHLPMAEVGPGASARAGDLFIAQNGDVTPSCDVTTCVDTGMDGLSFRVP